MHQLNPHQQWMNAFLRSILAIPEPYHLRIFANLIGGKLYPITVIGISLINEVEELFIKCSFVSHLWHILFVNYIFINLLIEATVLSKFLTVCLFV